MTRSETAQLIRSAAHPFRRPQSGSTRRLVVRSAEPALIAPDITVRHMCATDLRYLGGRLNAVYLDHPQSLTDRSGMFTTGLKSLRPLAPLRPITLLAFAHGDEFMGAIQFRQTAPDRRWTAMAVGVVDGTEDPLRVVGAMLEEGIRSAGQRGIKRLFARLPDEDGVTEAFHVAGFEAYMRESILTVAEIRGLSVVSDRVREQESADTWAVHQLYHASAPRTVQFAEAWTSHRWDPQVSRNFTQRVTSFLIDDSHQVAAHARVQVGNNVAVIETMYLGDRHQLGVELVRDVIRRIGEEHGHCRIFVTVRANQVELETALVTLGAVASGSQDLAVRYTTAKVSGKTVDISVPVAIEVLERVPHRVPTFMNRPNKDRVTP